MISTFQPILKFIDLLKEVKITSWSNFVFIMMIVVTFLTWMCIFQIIVVPGVILTIASLSCFICLALHLWLLKLEKKNNKEEI